MNPVLKQKIQTDVWDKMYPITEEEYTRRQVNIVSCIYGYFAYDERDPPNHMLLEQAIIKRICPSNQSLTNNQAQ